MSIALAVVLSEEMVPLITPYVFTIEVAVIRPTELTVAVNVMALSVVESVVSAVIVPTDAVEAVVPVADRDTVDKTSAAVPAPTLVTPAFALTALIVSDVSAVASAMVVAAAVPDAVEVFK